LLDPCPGLGEFDVDYISELFGGVLRNPNETVLLVGGQINPFVVLGVFSSKACFVSVVIVAIRDTYSVWWRKRLGLACGWLRGAQHP
jgi:hypothetical protein